MAAGRSMVRDGLIREGSFWGTINCDGIGPNGDICGVTTTSGLAWKIPGRTGDSPILGAGLYVDNEVGAAGSTGRGEANLYNLSSFLIVESMRRGMSPKDAGMEAFKRIKANTIEKRLLNSKGNPNFNIRFFVLNKRGEYAGVAMYHAGETKYAVCTENGGADAGTGAIAHGRAGGLSRERTARSRLPCDRRRSTVDRLSPTTSPPTLRASRRASGARRGAVLWSSPAATPTRWRRSSQATRAHRPKAFGFPCSVVPCSRPFEGSSACLLPGPSRGKERADTQWMQTPVIPAKTRHVRERFACASVHGDNDVLDENDGNSVTACAPTGQRAQSDRDPSRTGLRLRLT